MTDLYHQEIINALEGDSVPHFSFASIEQRARPLRKRVGSLRKAAISAILWVGLPCVAAAAVIAPSPALRHSIVQQLAHWNIKPAAAVTWQVGTDISLQDLRSSATFSVVIPSGLPLEARLVNIVRNGEDNTSFNLQYRLPDGRRIWFTLQKKAEGVAYVPVFIIAESDDSGHSVKMKKYPSRVWSTGDEVVTVASDGLSSSQIDNIKAAMNGVDVPLHHGSVR